MVVFDEVAFFVELGVGDFGAAFGLGEEGVVEFLGVGAGEVVAGFADLADVAFEDISFLGVAFHAFSASDVLAELSAALFEGEGHFFSDFVVVGDGFFGFRCKGDPDACHVDHDDEGADGCAASGLLEAVVFPAGFDDGFECAAGGLLVEEGDAVGVSDDSGGLVGGEVAAEGDGGFDLEGVASVDGGGSCGGGVELGLDAFEHAGEHLLDADGAQAVGWW